MIRLTPTQGQDILALLEITKRTDERYADVVVPIEEQIADQLRHPDHTTELLDTIAELLASPKAKTLLSHQMLADLRAAVLRPSELAKVRVVKDTFMVCAHCGTGFAEGEVATMYGQLPHCGTCRHPEIMTCSGCRTKRPLNTIMRLIQKMVKECKICEKHRADGTPLPIVPPPAVPVPDDDGPLRLGGTGRVDDGRTVTTARHRPTAVGRATTEWVQAVAGNTRATMTPTQMDTLRREADLNFRQGQNLNVPMTWTADAVVPTTHPAATPPQARFIMNDPGAVGAGTLQDRARTGFIRRDEERAARGIIEQAGMYRRDTLDGDEDE